MLAEDEAVLGEVLLDDFDHETFGELLVLIPILASRSHDLTDQDEHAWRVYGDEVLEGAKDVMRNVWGSDGREEGEGGVWVRDEVLEGAKDVMRNVWVSDAREEGEEWLGVLVEYVGREERSVVVGILERS